MLVLHNVAEGGMKKEKKAPQCHRYTAACSDSPTRKTGLIQLFLLTA